MTESKNGYYHMKFTLFYVLYHVKIRFKNLKIYRFYWFYHFNEQIKSIKLAYPINLYSNSMHFNLDHVSNWLIAPKVLGKLTISPKNSLPFFHFLKIKITCGCWVYPYTPFRANPLEGSYDKRRSPKCRSGQTSEWILNLT